MKRTLILCLMLLLLMPTAAFAHSKLDSAVPEPESSIAASPEIISLTYNTKIENLSKFTITNSANEEVELGDITVSNDTMSSTPAAPLPNDTYTVNWTIIGADGHMVKGKYTFAVDGPAETPAPTEEPAAQTAEPTASPAVDSPEPSTQATDAPASPAEADSSANGGNTALYLIGAVIIAAAAVILIVRRRKP